jgi:purine-nucleoside phosphorylase
MVRNSADEKTAREYLQSRLEEAELWNPRMAVILGSGLGGGSPEIENVLEFTFDEVPGMPRCNVPGHDGLIRFGSYGVMTVMVQLGRLHYYQGLDMEKVTLPICLMAGMGVERILMINTAGALNPAYARGNMMLIRDHINLMGANPLRGVCDAEGNPAFQELSNLYDQDAEDDLMQRSRMSGWPLAEGVLVGVSGPSYETAAELRFMRLVGGDAVSMSIVPEAIVARFLGVSVTGLSVITNTWDLRMPHAVSHEEVLKTAEEAAPTMRDIITAWLDRSAGLEDST